jgi:cytochrome c oxidase subunit II
MTIIQLERRIVWIALVFVLLLFGFAALAINTFHIGLPTCLTSVKPFEKGELITHSPTHYELHYVARMWRFEPPEVTIPAGSTVDIYLSAADVTHGLLLLGTDLNLMAVPGVVNYARVKFDKPRVYQLLCHEYCGTGHDRMAASLRVVDAASFHPQATAPGAQLPTDPRYKLLEDKECMSCHAITAEADLAPSFKGLYGRTEKMTDGSVVTVDDAYLREAIVHPAAQIVYGYDDLMPEPVLSEKEIEEMIQYLKTIK